MYVEQKSRIAGAILWQDRPDNAPQQALTVLPDGCMDILLSNGSLLLSGADTVPFHIPPEQSTVHDGLRFSPGVLPALLGIPAKEFVNDRILLDQFLPSAVVRRAQQQIIDTAIGDAPSASFPGFEAATASLLGELHRREKDGVDTRLIAWLAQSAANGCSVATISDSTGYSARQLYRISTDAFGYGLATLIRIQRFQSALALIRAGVSLADAAQRIGYSDQAHMTRDFVGLSGQTPGRFKRALPPA